MTVTYLRPTTGIHAAGARLGLDPDVVAAAAETAETAPMLAFSGWLASGKDSVADEVYRLLGCNSTKASLAAPVKDELTELMRIAAKAVGYRGAVVDVANEMGVPRRAAERTIDLIVTERREFDEAREDFETLTGWDRTRPMRLALQYWGTEVRRAQQPSYWMDRATEKAIETLATGVVPYYCDCRFPDEVTGLQDLGYRVVRLEVSRETQRGRLVARDGIEPDPETLYHVSETALDDFTGFDLVVDNNGSFEVSVEAVLEFAA